MKVFLTGGAGFVGSYIVEMLLEDDKIEKITILDNLLRGSHRNMASFIDNPRVNFVEGDIKDEALLEKCISESEYVFHLAAYRINRCAADPEDAFEVMTKGTFNVVNMCKKHNIKKLIYSSSASVYGLAQNFPTPETDNPYDNQTFYGAAKLWGEALLRSYHHMFGLNYVGFRYFNVYGPRMDTEGKYTEVMIKWLDCIKNGTAPKIFGDGSTSMDFVHVKDIAGANVAAFYSDVTNEVFNVGCQRETSLKELLELILKVNESERKPEFHPDNTINPVGKRIADISKLKDLLNYDPKISLEEGLKELSDWYFEIKGQVN